MRGSWLLTLMLVIVRGMRLVCVIWPSRPLSRGADDVVVSCEGWYHFGCVGLTKGDPRLEPDAQFICPPCNSSRCVFRSIVRPLLRSLMSVFVTSDIRE